MGSLLSSESSSDAMPTKNNATSIVTLTDLDNTGGGLASFNGSETGNNSSANNAHSSYNYDLSESIQSNNSIDLTNNSPTNGTNAGQQIANVANNVTSIYNNATTNILVNESEEFRFNLFGTDIYPLRWMTLPTLYSWARPLSSMAMIFGCVLPYVPQYLTIMRNFNCSGFSTLVCLTLLIANLLRVAFWFGHPFELPLLIQSGLMIIVQVALLELCVRVKREQQVQANVRKRNLNHLQYFWRWTDFISYIEFLLIFSTILGVTMYLLLNNELFVESIGFCATVTESMLGLPQVVKNYKNRSVKGMSLGMVLMWFAGDTFKTFYYIKYETPVQFLVCGLLQILIDLIILFQVCLFKQKAPTKSPISTNSSNNNNKSGLSHQASNEDESLSTPKEMIAL